MRFRLADAGPEWRQWKAFGACCEAAGLLTEQADAARLASCHLSYREIGEALSLFRGRRIGNHGARERTREAERRLKRVLPHLLALQRENTRALLAAVRNIRSHNPNIAIYRESMGVHDREPVRFTSRLMGECVEDLMDQPRRFLKDLPRLLDQFEALRGQSGTRAARD